MENYIAINIKPIYKTFNSTTLDYDMHRDYITTVHGSRIEIDGGAWYLWSDSYLVTSGDTRSLHGVHNRFNNDSDGPWNDIEFDYVPIRNF